nr:reverse transcriptase domain-containing protein [Tanacetum cinerariifolium]
MADDDPLFTIMRFIPHHEVVQKYGAILPNYLITQTMKDSEAYKTYHDLATGKVKPKPKYVRRSSRSKTEQEPKPFPAFYQRSLIQTHSLYASGSGVHKGTGVKPGVPDIPTYRSDEEEISRKSSDEEDDDEEANIGKEEDDNDQENDDNTDHDDDIERTNSDNDGDDFVHPKFSTHDDEARHEEEVNEEESFDHIVQTPSQVENTDDDESDDDSHGMNVEGDELDDEGANEEDDSQQQSSSMSSRFVLNMLNLSPNIGIDSIFNLNIVSTLRVDVPVTTTAESPILSATTLPLPSIPIILHRQQTPIPLPVNVPSSSFRNLYELELKKILIDKMESNKSIYISDEQKNLYKALVNASECNKLILDTYRETVTLKRHRDDEDKDEDPSAGSNRGCKRRRARKEQESTSVPKERPPRQLASQLKGPNLITSLLTSDYNKLRIQDIEDMLLLLVQGKLTNLTVDERLAFNRRSVKVKELQEKCIIKALQVIKSRKVLRTKLAGLLAGIHGLFSGRYCGLVRRVTYGYPWPRLGGTKWTLAPFGFVDVLGYFHNTACLYHLSMHVVVSLYRRQCVVMIPFLIAPRVSALEGCDRLVSEPQLAMPSHFHKKFRWGTIFATGRRSFKRKNHRIWVLIGLYPCHIKEKMTIKEFRRKFHGYKLVTKEEVEENEGLKEVWEHMKYVISDSDSDLESIASRNGNGGNNGCSYKTFIACNPKEFDGKGGAVALTRWIEKIESVFDNIGCTTNQRVSYNSYKLEYFKALLMEEFCPSNEMEKLENKFWNYTMVGPNHVAYTDMFHELAKQVSHLVTPESLRIKRILTGEAVHCGTLTKGNDKRKEMDELIPPRNKNVNTYPKCAKCYTFHVENAPCKLCYDCQKPRNYTRQCWALIKQVAPINTKQATGQARNSLAFKGNRNTRNNGNQARGKAFNGNAVEAL